MAHCADRVDDVTHDEQDQVEQLLLHGSTGTFRKFLGLLPDLSGLAAAEDFQPASTLDPPSPAALG